MDDSIRLGFIGLGRQAMFLLNGFMNVPEVRAVAGCDVYGIKRERLKERSKLFMKKRVPQQRSSPEFQHAVKMDRRVNLVI